MNTLHIDRRYNNYNSDEPRQFILGFDFEQEHKDLLPCPFCGSSRIAIYINGQEFSGKKSSPDTIKYYYTVQCLKCNMGHIGHFNSFQEAFKAWNNRAHFN